MTLTDRLAAIIATDLKHTTVCSVRYPSAGGDYLAICDCGRDAIIARRWAATLTAARQGLLHARIPGTYDEFVVTVALSTAHDR